MSAANALACVHAEGHNITFDPATLSLSVCTHFILPLRRADAGAFQQVLLNDRARQGSIGD
jgi:hypothetical protein